ncbi:MAG: glycosyltransferase family 1 protein [Spirochaetales bacterium]|nr:glycosyltransferase family 1 protein [Spirochaetales bacterium]
MKKPKIGIFTRPIDQGYSGSGHHLLEIVTHLLKQNNDEFDIHLLHYVKNDKPIYQETKELILPRNPLKASAILRKHNFDLLHYSPLTPYAPIWGVKSKKVGTIHGAEPDLLPHLYPFKARFHSRVTKPLLSRHMDHIFTVSETSRNYFSKNYHIPKERFSICYNAVNPNYKIIDQEKCDVRERLNTGKRFILHISNYGERKNPWTMMDAFAALLKEPGFDDYKLVLAGNRWGNEETKAYAAKLNISERVVFPGFISEEDAVGLFNLAELFLFPSLAEGYGMPNVEAMACGCPVITSNVFALPEIVGDAAMVLDDPLDSERLTKLMTQVLADENKKSELIEKGLKRAASFSWEESADTILKVYRNLLS